MSRRYSWDDYFFPGTKTLGNLLEERDPDELRRLEEELVMIRMTQLQTSPVLGSFDLAHMQAVHRHLFQDVYVWAGEVRTAPSPEQPPMSKDGVAYAPIDRIAAIWETEHRRATRSRLMSGAGGQERFIAGLARLWGETNHAHAFREGNTRTQAMFFEQLCQQAGDRLDVQRLAPQHPESVRDAFVDARYYFQLRGDATPLADVISKTISPIGGSHGRTARAATRPELINIDAPRPGVDGPAGLVERFPEIYTSGGAQTTPDQQHYTP